MCHHIDVRRWDERTDDSATDREAEDAERDDEMPEFLDEERATEVDLLTDGGDEE
ncbi:hypothetical protein [Salinigranum halophilum]|uniref:hypothetical protein n=1 Tax=Salinigranum halophilum TaxID=2565931 RepID=UPI00191C15FA|nr:hypothetical protein [Salinigranum halophilum]